MRTSNVNLKHENFVKQGTKIVEQCQKVENSIIMLEQRDIDGLSELKKQVQCQQQSLQNSKQEEKQSQFYLNQYKLSFQTRSRRQRISKPYEALKNYAQLLQNEYQMSSNQIEDKIQLHLNSTTQNLRTISYHIYNIVRANNKISIKQISYILFQILNQTKQGHMMLAHKYNHNLNNKTFQDLKNKSIKSAECQNDLNTKNMRRRLYDAINVMISAKILIKNYKNHTFSLYSQNLSPQNSLRFDESNNLDNSFTFQIQSYNQQQKRITQKKQKLANLKKMQKLLKMLYVRNSQINQQNYESYSYNSQKISLPILIVKNQPHMIINLQRQQVFITSQNFLTIFSDIQCLAKIFTQANPIKNEEIEK